MPSGAPFGIIFQKNGSEDGFENRDPLTSKPVIMNMSVGSQRGRLACALLKQEITARAQNAFRICFHWMFTKSCSEMLFELASIANDIFPKNEKDQCQEHIVHELTRPWPRPGDLF